MNQFRWMIAAALLAPAGVATSSPPANDDRSPTPTWKFAIQPAAEPKPPLRWRLLPETWELHEGDAAVDYLRAMTPEVLPHDSLKKLTDAYEQISDGRFDFQSPQAKEVRRLLKGTFASEIKRATFADRCDWGLLARQKAEGIALQLPEIQSMRTIARLLSVQTRIAIHDRDFVAALATLRSQFAAARHVGERPCNLIQSLVGVAIASLALNDLAVFIETPGAPNLYWALSSLPHPFVNFRRGLEGERIFIEAYFPGYRDALAKKKAPPPIDVQRLSVLLRELNGNSGAASAVLLVGALAYPARKFLHEEGWDKSTVESLSATAATALHQIAIYDGLLDDSVKWTSLPPHIALAGLQKADEQFDQKTKGMTNAVVAKLLLPAMRMAYLSESRLDRRIAGFSVVEAVRMQTKALGRLPISVDEITAVPLPDDPATGKPFDLKFTGDAITFVAEPPKSMHEDPHQGFRFELRPAGR